MKNKNNRNIIAGIVVVVAGTLLLLNNFDLLTGPVKYYLLSWKTLLIALGVLLMVSKKHLTGGILLSGLGVVFWLPALFGHQFQLGQVFLPAMLVVLGFVLLLKAGGLPNNRKRLFGHKGHEEANIEKTPGEESI